MICPNCGKEIPEESAFCLNCGASTQLEANPMNDVVDQDVLAPDTTLAKTLKTKWPWIIAAAAAVIAIIAIVVYANQVTPSRLTSTQLYNQELGVGLKLGMSKNKVDKLLGKPERVDDGYCYRDTELYAHYQKGKLSSLYVTIPNDRWNTVGGITIDSTTDDLVATIGEPDSVEHNDSWWYYFHGNQITGFEINRYGDDIMSIYIYDQDWAETNG